MKNIAFIDGQNLHLGSRSATVPWEVDLARLNIYLREKYHVHEAYYYLGFVDKKNEEIYDAIQKAGYILRFREHVYEMVGKKKGNVDTDIVFAIMKKLYLRESFDKLLLVTGDGDYKKLVDFLIEINKFEKILFPNRRFASSLYKSISRKYFSCLDDPDIQKKISRK